MQRVAFVLLIIVAPLLATTAAQPVAAIGQPLTDPSLPTGTVTVRVIAGDPAMPVPAINVNLDIAGKVRTVETDASGHAQFAGLTSGVRVTASVANAGPLATSATFPVPAAGGVRLLLSTKPWTPGASNLPRPRALSGMSRPVPGAPAGTWMVQLTYDDLALAAPAGLVVTLAGYAADETVTVVTRATDAKGIATFTDLDHSGATAYLAMALLPRGKTFDRLMSKRFIPDPTLGSRVVLSGAARGVTFPIDDLVTDLSVAVSKGKIRVSLDGVPDPGLSVTVADAATGKTLATGVIGADKGVVIAVTARPGQALYAATTMRGQRYVSSPFQTVPDRGSEIGIYVAPRLLPTFDLSAIADVDVLAVRTRFVLRNNSWFPMRVPSALPLPHGAKDPFIADEHTSLATVTPAGLRTTRPLQPGDTTIDTVLSLASTNGKVKLALDLPFGAYQSRIIVAKEPGMALEVPANTKVETRSMKSGDYFVVEGISIVPNQQLTATITMPKYTTAETVVRRTCRSMTPEYKFALLGKPMVDFTAPRLDGTKLKLSSLRGKPILVHFTSSWNNNISELPQLVTLARAMPDLAIVVVSSDADPKIIATTVGAKPPYHVVLDAPIDQNLGPITSAWGISLIPESFLIDRKGIVRSYFVNNRDWSTTDALACVQSLIR